MNEHAPGGPGQRPQWGEARKDDIGTAVGEVSRVWFTLARGQLDEVFFPGPDRACVRAMGLAVGTEHDWFDDADAEHAFRRPDERVPLLEIMTHHPTYQLVKETIADPRSPVVLQRVAWRAAPGSRLYVMLEPHIDNTGADNTACIFEARGATVLAARRDGIAVALAASAPWCLASAGFAGVNDGRTQLQRHGALVEQYACAEHGNVVVTGGLAERDFVLALGFGHTIEDAVRVASGALFRGYDEIRAAYLAEWRAWQERLARPKGRLWVRSACVLKTLEAKSVDGGRVAALAKPWGTSRGPALSGAYHLVWTRDLVQTIGGLVAAGADDEAHQALTFLAITQHPDGHWPQNMLLDGHRVWRHEELDESALPILLIELMRREQQIDDRQLDHTWPMIERAARHLVRTGPSSRLDRWEDTCGINCFTLATEIAALAAAAVFARERGEDRCARDFDAIAEQWDAAIERWFYRKGGALADRLGIAGYYVRARLPGKPLPELELPGIPSTELSPDALALVRFGLRDPNDSRIRDTVRAIDAVLATPVGWRRYPGDHYGEHADGHAFDGHGVGRSWPLLVGERAHYELAAGNRERAEDLLAALERLAGPTGMLPEQVWDAPDRADLHTGQPTHSAAPLGWAHAEYLKLCRSLADGVVFDAPAGLVRRLEYATRAAARPADSGHRAR